MNNKIRSIAEIAFYVAFVVVVAFGTPSALSYLLGTKYPVASITSSSMWPTLKENDIVFIKKVSKSELRIGDIVVYENARQDQSKTPFFTIHRIIKIDENTIKTKGDANKISDKAINFDMIIGRTITWKNKPVRLPYLGTITTWASSFR